MAKRFTDSDKWKDDWYISLPNDYKIVWQWLLDNCTHSGLCKRSMALLNLMCKVDFTENEMIDAMSGRILIHGNHWFIPKFLKFQYSTLNSNKAAVVSVVKDIFNHNLKAMIPESFGNDYIIKEESFENHCKMIKDKDKVKDKDKDKVKENGVIKKGEKFDEKFEKVFFDDGSWQLLGNEQKILAEGGDMAPHTIIKGSIY